jgi:hypothetical protein
LRTTVKKRHRAQRLRALCAAALVAGAPAGAAPVDIGFPVRTHNPFLQIYGLPAFETADLVAAGRNAWDASFDIANHADAATSGSESVVLDGESYYLTLAWRRRVSDWLEVGVDLPFTAHAEGFLDNFIESWHDLFGMTNSKRQGPANQLDFEYSHPDIEPFSLTSGVSGIGDVRLSAAVPLRIGGGGGTALTLRAGLKLPTGDADDLLGSGGTDVSLAVYYSSRGAFGVDRLDLSAHAGVLVPGDSDLFAPVQASTVPFGGMAADWRFTDRLRGKTALYLQGEFLKSALDELGSSIQLVVGGDYRFRDDDLALAFGIVEELFSDATVDFAIHLSLRQDFGGRL